MPAFKAASVRGFAPAFAAAAGELADVLLAARGEAVGEKMETRYRWSHGVSGDLMTRDLMHRSGAAG